MRNPGSGPVVVSAAASQVLMHAEVDFRGVDPGSVRTAKPLGSQPMIRQIL